METTGCHGITSHSLSPAPRSCLWTYQILLGNVSFPRWVDRNAKSLIKKLLVADITKRYGCMKAGAEDVKAHKWFGGFSWEELVNREMVAPIVPQVCKQWCLCVIDSSP